MRSSKGSAVRICVECGSAIRGDAPQCPTCSQEDSPVATTDSAPPPLPVAQPAPQAENNLLACPDCGRQVSRRATQCPSCACPIASSLPRLGSLYPKVARPLAKHDGLTTDKQRAFLKDLGAKDWEIPEKLKDASERITELIEIRDEKKRLQKEENKEKTINPNISTGKGCLFMGFAFVVIAILVKSC